PEAEILRITSRTNPFRPELLPASSNSLIAPSPRPAASRENHRHPATPTDRPCPLSAARLVPRTAGARATGIRVPIAPWHADLRAPVRPFPWEDRRGRHCPASLRGRALPDREAPSVRVPMCLASTRAP